MRSFLRHVLLPAVMLLAVLTLLTGAIYPAVVTAVTAVPNPRAAAAALREQILAARGHSRPRV